MTRSPPQLRIALAWLLARVHGMPTRPWVLFAAIVFAAAVFGAGHLPLAARLVPLTSDVVARVIAYNALGGLVFGWLYWKRGLEHAMLAHFCPTSCCTPPRRCSRPEPRLSRDTGTRGSVRHPLETRS